MRPLLVCACACLQFLLLLTALLIWEIIYILIEAIKYKARVSTLGWDIALAIILAIGVVFTADSQTHTQRRTNMHIYAS